MKNNFIQEKGGAIIEKPIKILHILFLVINNVLVEIWNLIFFCALIQSLSIYFHCLKILPPAAPHEAQLLGSKIVPFNYYTASDITLNTS